MRGPVAPERSDKNSGEGLLDKAGSDPAAVRALYDGWSRDYDADLSTWGYRAPALCARYLSALAPANATVLDAGCGTGLVGEALRAAGFLDVVGADFSADSLARAEACGAYRALHQADLTAVPIDFPARTFDALVCVGVMTYLADVEATCREFCRLVKEGSPIVLTQRSDLYEARDTASAFAALVHDRTWETIEVSPVRDYLPGNPEFTDVGVRYCVFRRR
jgi:predicted TPR repeat methyltransferase